MTDQPNNSNLQGAVDLGSPIMLALNAFKSSVLETQAHAIILIADGPYGTVIQAINPRGNKDSIGLMEIAKMMLIQKTLEPGEPQPVARPELTEGEG